MDERCEWKFDDIHDCYETSCNEAYCFTDGGVKENGYKYCPNCGKEIEVNNG